MRHATTTRTQVRAARAALSIVLLAGCAANVELDAESAEQEVDAVEQAVSAGTRVASATLPDNGIVRVFYGEEVCSGVLLTNRWVLTAAHCFCRNEFQFPSTVKVSIYGTEDEAANPTLKAFYTAQAAHIEPHPEFDVALIKLAQTLPFAVPAQLYTGNGNDLVGQNAMVIGFGHTRFVNGAWVGGGESQNVGDMRITSIDSVGNTMAPVSCPPPIGNTFALPSPGPRLQKIPGRDTIAQKGDSGSPAVIGAPSNPRVIGVLSASDGVTLKYTGVWKFRDWLKQKTDIWTPTECTSTTLPSSLNADKPTFATGPDNKLHAVAVLPDFTIGHWTSDTGKQWSFKGKVAGASTDTRPALTNERVVGSDGVRRLGLAFRNKTTGTFAYARWTASSNWSAPQTTILPIQGGLNAHQTLIAVVGTDGRAGVTGYDVPSNAFVPVQWAPAAAPRVDPARGVSVIFDVSTQVAQLGWLTPQTAGNKWVQAFGSWSCLGSSGSFICNAEPAFATDWTQAAFAYSVGDRVYLETVRPTATFPRHERRALNVSVGLDWGWSHFFVGNQTVNDFKGEIFALRSIFGGSLTFSPAGNCFGNQF